MFKQFFFLAIFACLFSACAIQQNGNSIETIYNQEENFHKAIEDTTAANYPNGAYKSLAFGEMKVYKPVAFIQLDSIYALKEKYIEEKDWRGLRDEEIEEKIPGYRAAAQEVIDEVQYEIEHIFEVAEADSFQLHHAFYLFDFQNKLINITPFYDFRVAKADRDYFYKYQFNQHFLTDRDLYISREEWDFLQLLKGHETDLIRSTELQTFMNHAMLLMRIASVTHSVDLNEIAKYLVILKLKELGGTLTINNIDQLFENVQDERVINYTIDVEWQLDETSQKNKSTFTFSPYLEIESIDTQRL